MRGADVPQADNLDKVRRVVDAVAKGATSIAEVHRATYVSPRHVGYYLNAARTLDLVREAESGWVVTAMGSRLASTHPGSEDENEALRSAIRSSPILTVLAANLLAAKGPTPSALAKRISAAAELSSKTAERRAGTLLRWRKRLLSKQMSLEGASVATPSREQQPLVRERERGGLIVSHIEVDHFGPIRSLSAGLRPFTVIVGRNATGKSTFMDSLAFVSDCLNDGIGPAVEARASRFEDLVWNREGQSLSFAFVFALSSDLPKSPFDRARYEITIGVTKDGSIGNLGEKLALTTSSGATNGVDRPARRSGVKRTEKKILSLTSASGTAWFGSERSAWKTVITLGTQKLALSEVQDDKAKFPVASRIKALLKRGLQRLALHPRAMIEPCSPRKPQELLPDGSNLPLVVRRLKERDARLFEEWTDHLREALPDVRLVGVAEREEDRHLYLKLTYKNGLELPAWRLSEGTLRIIALTLIPFAAEGDAIYLIEEPENGVHPQAIEAVHQTLARTRRVQIIVATHSPVFVGTVEPHELLCFAHRDGMTSVIPGDQHPALKRWQRDVDLGTLFAAKVLE